jgi:hypothetical protein
VFICRIIYIGRKVVSQFARLLALLEFALLNLGFQIYDSGSDPKFFLVEVRNVVNSKIHQPVNYLNQNVVLSRIGVIIVGARKFSKHLQSSKMPKTNDQHIFSTHVQT